MMCHPMSDLEKAQFTGIYTQCLLCGGTASIDTDLTIKCNQCGAKWEWVNRNSGEVDFEIVKQVANHYVLNKRDEDEPTD